MTKRGRKAWTKWRRLVSEQERSGQDVAAFCREQGLCRSYFFLWKKRLRESAKFVEVRLAEASSSAPDDSRIEVRLANGRSLVVGRGCDAEQVRALLAVVEGAG